MRLANQNEQVVKTQADYSVRVVALENLIAMCEFISGESHEFSVVKVGPQRVQVQYTNPTEYGHVLDPITAYFPCWQNPFEPGRENPMIALEIVHLTGGKDWHGEAWQAFRPLLSCPKLYRNAGAWEAEEKQHVGTHRQAVLQAVMGENRSETEIALDEGDVIYGHVISRASPELRDLLQNIKSAFRTYAPVTYRQRLKDAIRDTLECAKCRKLYLDAVSMRKTLCSTSRTLASCELPRCNECGREYVPEDVDEGRCPDWKDCHAFQQKEKRRYAAAK